MPAARYWRAVGLEAHAGGDLELSALHVYDAGGRVDAGATLTSTIGPTSGALGNLQDSDFGTTARFAAAAVWSPGFALHWDFGTTVDVYGVRAGGPSAAEFLKSLTLQYSSDGVTWGEFAAALGDFIFPGADELTEAPTSSLPHMETGRWTEMESSGLRNWYPASMSADGATILAPAYGGYLYTSDDGGVTWVERTAAGSRSWSATAISADGVRMAACVENGYVYISDDSGETWTEQSVAGSRPWFALNMSADGLKVIALPAGGYLHVTSDGGATWSEKVALGSRNWWSASVSADGSKMLAAAYGGYLYTSDDGGVTWVERTAAGSRSWSGTAMSSAGVVMLATASGSRILIYLARDPMFADPLVRTTSAGTPEFFATSPIPDFTTIKLPDVMPWRDMEFAGNGKVTGAVKEKNTPANTPLRRRVRLVREIDGLQIRETWSDASTGAYEFLQIDERHKYSVISYDHLTNYRAVIADGLTPESMT